MAVPTTLAGLLTVQTQAQQLATLLAYLAAPTWPGARPLPVTDWYSGGVANTLVNLQAQSAADLQAALAAVAAGGFLGLAPGTAAGSVGDWLGLLAAQNYSVARNPAVAAQGKIRLTCAAGFGPYTITLNQLWAADPLGRRVNSVAIGTLPSGGTLDLTFQAELPGASYNLTLGTTMVLQTPLSGVSIALLDSGSGTWPTVLGADAEADASLVTRCQLKWATLAGYNAQGGATSAAYDYWARNAPLTVTPATRTFVLTGNPDGPGTLRVYVAPAGGFYPSDADASVVAINAQIQLVKPISAAVVVHAATGQTLTLTGTVHYKAASLTLAQAKAQLNLNLAALATALAINDTVFYSAVEEYLMLPAGGVQNIRDVGGLLVNGATADVALGGGAVYAVAAFADVGASMTWVAV